MGSPFSALLEHLEHPARHHEAAEDVDRRHEDGEPGQERDQPAGRDISICQTRTYIVSCSVGPPLVFSYHFFLPQNEVGLCSIPSSESFSSDHHSIKTT